MSTIYEKKNMIVSYLNNYSESSGLGFDFNQSLKVVVGILSITVGGISMDPSYTFFMYAIDRG